jgi:organic hydroperoxide reductase OsmC/OhrA
VSQVAAKKKLALRDERVKVVAHFRESGSVLAGTKEGACHGFDIEVSIESDASAQDIAALLRLAHHMCFTEDALSGNTRVTARHRLNGQPLDL